MSAKSWLANRNRPQAAPVPEPDPEPEIDLKYIISEKPPIEDVRDYFRDEVEALLDSSSSE